MKVDERRLGVVPVLAQADRGPIAAKHGRGVSDSAYRIKKRPPNGGRLFYFAVFQARRTGLNLYPYIRFGRGLSDN